MLARARHSRGSGAAPRLSVLLQRLCDGDVTADGLRQQLEARAATLGLLAAHKEDGEGGQQEQEQRHGQEQEQEDAVAERLLAATAAAQQRLELPVAGGVSDQDAGCDVDVLSLDGALSWGEPEEASQELSQELRGDEEVCEDEKVCSSDGQPRRDAEHSSPPAPARLDNIPVLSPTAVRVVIVAASETAAERAGSQRGGAELGDAKLPNDTDGSDERSVAEAGNSCGSADDAAGQDSVVSIGAPHRGSQQEQGLGPRVQGSMQGTDAQAATDGFSAPLSDDGCSVQLGRGSGLLEQTSQPRTQCSYASTSGVSSAEGSQQTSRNEFDDDQKSRQNPRNLKSQQATRRTSESEQTSPGPTELHVTGIVETAADEAASPQAKRRKSESDLKPPPENNISLTDDAEAVSLQSKSDQPPQSPLPPGTTFLDWDAKDMAGLLNDAVYTLSMALPDDCDAPALTQSNGVSPIGAAKTTEGYVLWQDLLDSLFEEHSGCDRPVSWLRCHDSPTAHRRFVSWAAAEYKLRPQTRLARSGGRCSYSEEFWRQVMYDFRSSEEERGCLS